jgi:hypothetical protein
VRDRPQMPTPRSSAPPTAPPTAPPSAPVPPTAPPTAPPSAPVPPTAQPAARSVAVPPPVRSVPVPAAEAGPPPAIAELIRRSPGRVVSTRRILQETGYDRFAVAEMVKARLLDRLAPAFVRLRDDDAPHQAGHLAVAYLRHHRPGSAIRLSGRDALRAGGVDPGPGAVQPLALVERDRRTRIRQARFETSQRVGVAGMACEVRHGLPFAELAVQIADSISALCGDDARRALVYRALVRHSPNRVALLATWAIMGDHPGARWLVQQAALGVLEHDSPAEHDLYTRVFAPHGPLPDCQVWLTDSIRADFAYLYAGLTIERLGEAEHANRVVRDATRAFAVRNLGLESIAVTRGMDRDAAGLAAHIHQTRRHREDLIARGLLVPPTIPVQWTPRLTPLRTLGPLG